MKLIRPNILSSTDGSFSRASVGSYIDSAGTLKIAAINTPRFDYSGGTFQGFLCEPSATNLVLNSETIAAGANVSVLQNYATKAPDQEYSADLVQLGPGYNLERYIQDFTYTFTNITTYVWSAFVKQNGPDIRAVLRTSKGYIVFGFDAGVTLQVGNIEAYGVYKLADGWYRVWIKASTTAANQTEFFRVQLADQNNNLLLDQGLSYFSMWVWGLQAEVNNRLTSYIRTSGSAETRAADIVSGSGLIYADVINTDANYSSATTYALGARVTYSGKIFESLQNTNINHDPLTSPTWWLLIGPDNKHAALDNSVSTITQGNGVLTLVVKPGAIDSVGLVDMEGVLMEFAVTDETDGLLFSRTVGLSGVEVTNWYDYFFLSPLSDMKRTQYVFYDLPSQYADPIITIRIKNGTNTAKLGLASFGKLSSIGEVQYGASAGIVDYSVKSTDEYGNTSLLQRNFSKRLSARCFVPNKDINRVQRTLYSIRATPVVWVGVDDPTYEEAMIVWGFYKDFTTEISYPTYSLISIEIEGLS